MNSLLQNFLAAYHICEDHFQHLTCCNNNAWHCCLLHWLYTTWDDPHIHRQRNKSHHVSVLEQTTLYYSWGGSKVLKYSEQTCSYKGYMRFKDHMVGNIYIMGCILLPCENGTCTVQWNIRWTLIHATAKHWKLRSCIRYRLQELSLPWALASLYSNHIAPVFLHLWHCVER
jgi:hypothetical protein